MNLIPVPGTSRTLKEAIGVTPFERGRLIPLLPKGGDLSPDYQLLRAARARRELEVARKALRSYNRLIKRLGLTARHIHGLHLRATLLLEDTPFIQGETPLDHKRPIPNFKRFAPPTRAELRAEARRNRVPLPMLWDRFPPETEDERAQMAKDVGLRPSADPFISWLHTEAKTEARRQKTTVKALLADPIWIATQKAFYTSALTLELEL
jgi:hypothetical protein